MLPIVREKVRWQVLIGFSNIVPRVSNVTYDGS